MLSCGGSSTSSSTPTVASRAFVSNSIAGLAVIDADKDVRVPPGAIAAGNSPGMMVVTPNRALTLVFSRSGNSLALVSNSQESTTASVTLPGPTESIVVSPDSQTAYVAVPTAPMVGLQPGAIELINLSTGQITAEVSVPSVHFLAIANNGNRLLAFSDNSNSVGIVTPANIGNGNPVLYVDGFDRPVSAFFSSDDNTAFVLNCGAECGGLQASVQKLDLAANALGATVSACDPAGVATACGASVAYVSGTTMYVAGSYQNPSSNVPQDPCPGQTVVSSTCGLLSVIDLNSMQLIISGIVITNGYHNRIALGANDRLYIGARTCTEVTDVSGCLSIYNTQAQTVVIPPTNGDVTGLQPIPKRTVFYVVQGGELEIYETSTDALIDKKKQIDISGEAVDVKTVDF